MIVKIVKGWSFVREVFGYVVSSTYCCWYFSRNIVWYLFPHMDIYFNIGNVVCQLLEGNRTYSGFFLTMASIAKHKIGNKTFVKPILILYLVGTLLSALVAVIVSSILLFLLLYKKQYLKSTAKFGKCFIYYVDECHTKSCSISY